MKANDRGQILLEMCLVTLLLLSFVCFFFDVLKSATNDSRKARLSENANQKYGGAK